jgi:hypothetical protein
MTPLLSIHKTLHPQERAVQRYRERTCSSALGFRAFMFLQGVPQLLCLDLSFPAARLQRIQNWPRGRLEQLADVLLAQRTVVHGR